MDLNEYLELVNHIVFPYKLPDESTNKSFETNCLKLTYKILKEFSKTKCLFDPKFSCLIRLFERWITLQGNSIEIDSKKLREELKNLSVNDSLAIYMYRQNVCLLITMYDKEVIMSYFQTSVDNTQIMSNTTDIRANLPLDSIHVHCLDTLKSEQFSNLITDLASKPILETLSNSRKAHSDSKEIRDVAKTDLISNWLFSLLISNNSPINQNNFPKRVNKKFRDEINLCKGAYIPFRRSGMWMSIKGIVEIQLCNLYPNKNEGLIYYKILMVLVLENLCSLSLEFSNLNDDLRLQMIKKLAKRIYKLSKITTISNDILTKCNNTINNVRKLIEDNHRDLLDSYNLNLDLNYDKINLSDTIHFEFKKIKKKFDNLIKSDLNTDNKKSLSKIKRNLISCDFPDISYLDCESDQLGIHLYDMENWILNHTFNNYEYYSKLCQLYNEYIFKGYKYYENDQLGYSRMVLVCVKVICCLDQILCQKYPLLKEHNIGIELKLIEYLLVIKFEDLTIVYDELIEYIISRNSKAKYKSLIDSKIDENSFSVRYFNTNEDMQTIKNSIELEAERKKDLKINEYETFQKEYNKLQSLFETLECECDDNILSSRFLLFSKSLKCQKCLIKKRMDEMFLTIFEWPLPLDINQAESVVFELRIPLDISQLRDSLFLIKSLTLKSIEHISSKICHETWREYDQLEKYSLNKSNYISLGSQTKSFLKTHYNSNHISRPIDEFLKNNGLSVNQVSLTTKELIKIDDNFFDHLQEKNTFKAVEPYSRLQYAINSTTHSENQILAELNHLPTNLTAKELVKFGFMRSGHQLQMRNLLDCLETRVLSLNDVSVTALLSQLLWQIGPIDYAYEREFKIPSSHFDLLNDEFISILSRIIKTYLDQINNKWNDCFTLYNLTNITLRCFSVNKSHYLIDLLLECRKVAFKWIKDLRCFIEEQLPTNIAKYSKKLALISCFLILTYDVDKNQIDKILFESTHVLEWLEAMKIINTFKLSNDYKNDIFVVNLLKRIEICSLNIVEQYIKVITHNSESLTNFVKKHINFDTNSNWKCINVYPIWYLNESNNETIHINITGEILRNYFPISCLPINVTNDNIYKSFFKSFNLESTLNIKETSFSSKIQDITFEFFYDKNNELIIKKYFKNFESYFIESTQIEDYLPRLLINNYSHWYNKTQNRIEFRSKYYSDEYSKSLNSQCEYVLDLKNLILSDSHNRELINVQSNTFLEITTKFSNRLDSNKYVHIFKINSNELIINSPRLDLNFRLDKSDQSIWSEEFDNFKVSNSQKIDTLIGLENYILLRENEAYPIRKLIIPHGTVITQNDSIKRKIKIRHDSSLEEECYFVYHIDNDLKRLKADDSNTAWLYLALLHATTSTLLEDEFLNMTGTEMALYLLQSAICWSIRPLSKASINILHNLMCLSPTRLYYPSNLKVLQNVKWPTNVPAYCIHDGFQFIAEKLIKDSLLLEFAFEKKEEINDELINTSNLILAQRAYFRAAKLYRQSQLITLLNWKQDEPKEFIEFKTETIKETIDNIRLIQTKTNTIHGNEFDFSNDETNCFNWKKANELNLIDKNISCWIESNELTSVNIEQYFLDNWLELYKLAIRSYKSKEDEIKFKFILGYFAYKEIKLDYLILFKKLPHFRDFDYYEKDYNLEDGCKLNLAKLDNILTLNYINLQQYNERKPLYHMHKNDRKREYISNKINDIKLICEHLKKYAEDLEYKKDDEFYEANIVDFKMKLNGIHNKIKSLFESWKNNKELKIFFNHLKSHINELVDNIDVKLNCFNKKPLILYKQSAELLFELKLNKYDEEFYSEAKLLFETGKMNSLNFKIQFNKIKKEEFPLELDKFEMNNLSQKYFKDLKESWNIYYSTNQMKVFANCENEFNKSIKFYSNKLKYYEKELKKFYTPSCRITNCLSRTGLWPCFSPLFYLRNLLSNTNDIEVNKVFNNIIGSFAVLMSLLKRTIRCVKYYYNKEKHGHLLEKELLNEPFSDWTPSDKPEWLILQLELDITIRKNQVIL